MPTDDPTTIMLDPFDSYTIIVMPTQTSSAGDYHVILKARDRATNSTLASHQFMITINDDGSGGGGGGGGGVMIEGCTP